MAPHALGIDIGDTIIIKGGSTFLENHLQNKPFPHVFEAIEYLCSLFGERVFLVSSCTEEIERKTNEWLDYHDFFGRTGILRSNARFCRERRLKDLICKELSITHFIDNRVGVLRSLTSVEHLYCFNPGAFPEKDYSDVRSLHSWSDVRSVFPHS